MKSEIEKSVEIIKNGGIILYPTDTVWGLGCDPNNDSAIEKINKIKKRATEKSFILLVNSEQLLNRYAKIIPEVCYDLIDFAEKPLTLIYPESQFVSSKITGEDNSIAIRIVKNKFCEQLISRLKHGIVSTSANVSGEKFPSKYTDISKDILDQVDYIVDSSFEIKDKQPSQIIKIAENGEISIIRK